MRALIQQAIAFIASLVAASNTTNTALAEANAVIADQKKTIDELQAQHAADEIDDQTLIDAAAAADKALQETKTKFEAVQSELADINTAGQELALAINQHPEAPIVNSVFAETGNAGVLDAVPNAFPALNGESAAPAPTPEDAPAEEVKPAEAAA